MEKKGIHRVTVDDGVELAGHVYGRGPAVVLVPGAVGDGESYWSKLTPHLSDRFRCYLMDLRGTGMSDDHPDLSPQRMVRDLVEFVESIGGPVGVFGTSGGGELTLGATAQSAAISAAASYEPGASEVQTREQVEAFQEQISRMGELTEQGQLREAAEVFLNIVLFDGESEIMSRDYLEAEAGGRYIQRQLREFEQMAKSQYSPTAPEELAKINAPLLLLTGTRGPLSDWFDESLRYVAEHVDHAQVRTLEGLGHAGPVLEQPMAVANELRQFFEQTLTRGEAPRAGSRM